jgi:hypothetical protein
VAAFISLAGFTYTSQNIAPQKQQAGELSGTVPGAYNNDDSDTGTIEGLDVAAHSYHDESQADQQGEIGVFQFARQLVHHSNFWLFVSVNFLQIFHMTFNSNFFPLFLEQFFHTELSSWTKSWIVSGSIVLAPMLSFTMGPWVARFGYYKLIRSSFVAKLLLSLLVFLAARVYGTDLGTSSLVTNDNNQLSSNNSSFNNTMSILLCLFLVLNSVCASASFSYFNIVVSDLAEEDFVKNKRSGHLLSAGNTQSVYSLLKYLFHCSIFWNECFIYKTCCFSGTHSYVALLKTVWVSARCLHKNCCFGHCHVVHIIIAPSSMWFNSTVVVVSVFSAWRNVATNQSFLFCYDNNTRLPTDFRMLSFAIFQQS